MTLKNYGTLQFSLNGDLQRIIGDFTFFKPKLNDKLNDKSFLISNCQKGIFQFNQFEMFAMLKRIQVNPYINKFDDFKNDKKKLEEMYGITIGPDNWIYCADNDRYRIIKLNIFDYDKILNQEKINQEIIESDIDIKIFAKGVDRPNYTNWLKAKDIGMNFISFSKDKFVEIEEQESDDDDDDDE